MTEAMASPYNNSNKAGDSNPNNEGSYKNQLIKNLTFEIIPLKSVDDAIAALPPHSSVSVTCSPVKGIAETIRLTEVVRDAGHTAIPHIAARMVTSTKHVKEIATWFRTEEIGRLFLVGGDADPAEGPYTDAAHFLSDLLDEDPRLHTIGVTSYPDGHSFIPNKALDDALMRKQEVLRQADVAGYTSTQMCFDHDQIIRWTQNQRSAGMSLPLHLGLPGVVERARLMKMGVRLGIGTSLKFLKKNRKALTQLMSQADYDPMTLLDPMDHVLESLDVQGLHCFTFNAVEATESWRQQHISGL